MPLSTGYGYNCIMCPLKLCIQACALGCVSECVSVWQHSPVISIDFSRRGLSHWSPSLSVPPPPLLPLLSCVQIAIILFSRSSSLWALPSCSVKDGSHWSGHLDTRPAPTRTLSPSPPSPPRWRIPLSMGISGKLRAVLHGSQLTGPVPDTARLPSSTFFIS